MSATTPAIGATATARLDACDSGRGREARRASCTPPAGLACRAEPPARAERMTGIVAPGPDARYSVEAPAANPAGSSVPIHAAFHATHTGEGGPVPPTRRALSGERVCVTRLEGPGIGHTTRTWNPGRALRQLHRT